MSITRRSVLDLLFNFVWPETKGVDQPSATLGSHRLQPDVHEKALILDTIQIHTGLLPFTKE